MKFDHEIRQIDSALARFRAEDAKLYRPDGSRVYGDEEHEERLLHDGLLHLPPVSNFPPRI